MATVAAPSGAGVFVGPEYKQLFRSSLMLDFCQSFRALEASEAAEFLPPNADSIDRAWELFCRLNIRHLIPTRILPSPEGGVALCFSRHGRYADFECFNSGSTMVAMSDRRGKVDVFEIDPSREKDVDDVIFRIGQFLDPSQNALPLATANR
jgi:hypothetical protein